MTPPRAPDWGNCPVGKVMLATGATILVLLGTLTVQIRAMSQRQTDIRERLRAVETNLVWLCKANGLLAARDRARPPVN